MRHQTRNILYFFLAMVLMGCEVTDKSESTGVLPEVVDFNFHVKPILSDRCFACHGPDENKIEADLRLDLPESALGKALEDGRKAFVPGSRRRSVAFQNIISDDPETQMPPPSSNLALSAHEIALIGKWIDQGAEYKPHWSFTKPVKSPVPTSGSDWAINEIDHFVGQQLEIQDISPAPEAQPEQLLRRLFFDLTGLPPSLSDLDRWLDDQWDKDYISLVDSLLALPAFGERIAAHWLDVARFADSEGYLDDFHHTFWPYRDWVIRAFNENLPYRDFILWQIGGDQIPNASREQKLATAFNRHHKQNSEGGIIPEEFRVEYVADRTNTVGSAFMALTVGCARCHDHKYDPFSQKNYYELFSFFNSTIERGDGIFSLNAIENGQSVPNEYSMNAGPVLALPSEEVAAIHDFLLKQIEEKNASIHEMALENDASFVAWKDQQHDAQALADAVEKSTVTQLTFDDMAHGKSTDRAPGAGSATYHGGIYPVPGKKGLAIRSNAEGQFVADGSRSSFERNEPFTISFWIQVPKQYTEAHVLYNGNNRIQGYRGWDIMLDSNKVHFRLNHAHPYQSIDIYTPDKIPVNEWVHFVWTYDGSSDALGMRLYKNGNRHPFAVQRNYLYRSTKPYMYDKATVYMPYKGLIIGNRHYDQDFTGGLLDEIRILDKQCEDVVAHFLFDPAAGREKFLLALDDHKSLGHFYDLFIDHTLAAERAALRRLQWQEIRTIDTVQEIMVMGDLEDRRPTYILDRGVYDAHGAVVEPSMPADIMPWPDELPRNRYGLGQWLIHPDHPLTARVAVNQFWYLMFGRGIVETVEDFGAQGALPSHPKLLDWLAVDFQEHSWDVKRLIRQMVTSATYRQSSKIRPELAGIDPDNKLLARGQRYRRSAEMIRDNILSASGLLHTHIGGPSVFPYQPPGLWKEVMAHGFFPEYQIDYGKGLYRRSIYTFWKRNMPPPGMLVFDASSRAECQMRRQLSNTPLQALVLLNDVQIIEGCRAIAERLWTDNEENIEKTSNDIFRLLTSRHPTQREQEIVRNQFDEEKEYFHRNPAELEAYLGIGKKPLDQKLSKVEIAALARVTNTILNTTEAYYKN